MTTYFIGNYFEQTGSTITKYYYADTQRVAMRVNGALYFLLSDHLGSTSLTTDASGNVISELRYTAWGQVRYSSGTTPTQYTYTGQYSNVSEFGLMYYNARWYDPSLGRFAQADALVPGGVQGYDRYAYVNNNPVRYSDPSGHMAWMGDGGCTDHDDCSLHQKVSVIPTPNPNPSITKTATPQPFSSSLASPTPTPAQILVILTQTPSPPPGWTPAPPPLNSRQVAIGSDWISRGLDFVDAMHWIPDNVHVPVIGIAFDSISQLAGDSGKGYTFPQETSRVMIHAAEGQLSSLAGATLAGLDSIPGAVTGPGDVIIIGGSYVVGSSVTSFWLNQANGLVIDLVPGASNYIPYEPVPENWFNK